MDLHIASLISVLSVISGERGGIYIFVTSEGTWRAVRGECSKYNGQLLTDELNESLNSCLEDMLSKTPSIWTGCHTQLTPYLIHKGCFEYKPRAFKFQPMQSRSVGECYMICKDQTQLYGFGIRNATECACIGEHHILPIATSSYEKCLTKCSLFPNDRHEYCGGENAISFYVLQDTRTWDYRKMQPGQDNLKRCALYNCVHDERKTQKENCSSKYQRYCESKGHATLNKGYTFDETIQFCASLNQYVGLPPEDCREFQSYRYWVDIYRYQIPILTETVYAKEDGEEFQCGLLVNRSFVLINCTSRHQGLCVTNTISIPGKVGCKINKDMAKMTTEKSSSLPTTIHRCAGKLFSVKYGCVNSSSSENSTWSDIQSEESWTSDPSNKTGITAGISVAVVVLIVLVIMTAVAYRRGVCNGGRATNTKDDKQAPQIEENKHFDLEQITAKSKIHEAHTIPNGYEDIRIEHAEREYDELNKVRPKNEGNAQDREVYVNGSFYEDTDAGVYNYENM